jgi:hypothetical protein
MFSEKKTLVDKKAEKAHQAYPNRRKMKYCDVGLFIIEFGSL